MIKASIQVPPDRPWLKKYSQGINANLEYPDIPVYERLENSAAKYTEKVALSFYGKEISYRELNELSDRFANALQHYGIKKGDRILFMLPTCTQFFIAYFGALKAGAISIPLNPLYTVKELEYFFQDAEPRLVITLDAFYEKTKQAAEVTPQIEKIIVTNLADFFPPVKRVLGKLLKKVPTADTGDAEKLIDFIDIEAKYNKVDIDPQEDLALIIYTSGTTGTAKGAMITHFNIVAANINVSAWVASEKKINNDSVFLTLVPTFHIYVPGFAAVWPILEGGKNILQPKFHTEDAVKAIVKDKVNVFFGVPAIFSAFLKYFRENPQASKFTSLQLCSCGSAALPDYLIKELAEYMPNNIMVEAYGATENTGIAVLDPFDSNYKKAFNSVGIPFLSFDVKIVDPETREEVPPNAKGEFVIGGPQIFKGYWKNPEKTAKCLQNGWYYSNDIVRMDEDGAIYVEGRMDDMINIRGEKAWPREIEKVIEDHPKVKETAVVGVKDDYYGEKVKAFIVAHEGHEVKDHEIRDFCQDKLVKHKIPHEIEFVSELPKSHIGKTLHYKLRQKNNA